MRAHAPTHFATSKHHKNKNRNNHMGSKPKVQKQESAEEIERKAKELAQREANENTASRRKYKQSSVLGGLLSKNTVISNAYNQANTGSDASSNTKTGT